MSSGICVGIRKIIYAFLDTVQYLSSFVLNVCIVIFKQDPCFSVSGRVFTDLEKMYPSPAFNACAMLLKQLSPLSAIWIVLPDM